MACVDLPIPTPPTLPGGLTLGAALNLGIPPHGVDFCCKVPDFPGISIPIPLPPLVLNPAVIAALNAALASMNAYHDAVSFNCPFE